jgi:hypothetical protein
LTFSNFVKIVPLFARMHMTVCKKCQNDPKNVLPPGIQYEYKKTREFLADFKFAEVLVIRCSLKRFTGKNSMYANFKLFCFYISSIFYTYIKYLEVNIFFKVIAKSNPNGLWSADPVQRGSKIRTENTLVPQYVAAKCLAFRSGRHENIA